MNNEQSAAAQQDEFISIMTDPDLHPLPITPNDPLSIFQSKLAPSNQGADKHSEAEEKSTDELQLQGQGSGFEEQRTSPVIEAISENDKKEILQTNLVQLKLQNKLFNTPSPPSAKAKASLVHHVPMPTDFFRAESYSRFFVIKSYTEEDVHKAIKYEIWSSTEAGNRILDEAYQEVQALRSQLASDVYLFFSVNQSKHFCGVAKMKSAVKYKQEHHNLWKQNGKWTGSIDIQWLEIKDIPNTDLFNFKNPFHENRPVYQGRDCQEIPPPIGEQMLTFFKKYNPVTRLLDDFKFYDEREDLQKQANQRKQMLQWNQEEQGPKVRHQRFEFAQQQNFKKLWNQVPQREAKTEKVHNQNQITSQIKKQQPKAAIWGKKETQKQ